MRANERGRHYRYGDFPHLFWDAQKDALIDLTSAITLSRLLTRADAETVGQLVPPELLRDRLDGLPVPEYTKTFWRSVLAYIP